MGGDSQSFDSDVLLDLVTEHCDPRTPAVEPASRLDDLGVVGLARLRLITTLEERYRVSFPADLVAAIETVEDVVYYTAVKVSQRADDACCD